MRVLASLMLVCCMPHARPVGTHYLVNARLEGGLMIEERCWMEDEKYVDCFTMATDAPCSK